MCRDCRSRRHVDASGLRLCVYLFVRNRPRARSLRFGLVLLPIGETGVAGDLVEVFDVVSLAFLSPRFVLCNAACCLVFVS